MPLRVTRTVQGVRAAPVHDTLTGHVTVVVDDSFCAVNPSTSSPYWVSGLVTRTVAVPAVIAPVVHDSSVSLVCATEVHAIAPMVTVAAGSKPVPAMVTEVPPAADPELGVMDDTVGAAPNGVKVMVPSPAFVSELPPLAAAANNATGSPSWLVAKEPAAPPPAAGPPPPPPPP